ncbi:hypothetical protein GPECTOR_23g30 [Gonium pectorale]|uniref:Uncharacterized protein n=1 Tax=Gonium pectorale TaxID=33097 RepID=A0A150GH36_GONPE|nr:hypothetical protein GPECTOR_23g30 [Gonium pectorale]|eukprot:KXZ49099.1 hypothetical protein GPECTOR_23g30 [Gonium pectorale]
MKWSWETLRSPEPPHTALLEALLERADKRAAEVARIALGRNQSIVRLMSRSPLILAVQRGAPLPLLTALGLAARLRNRGAMAEKEGDATALGWALKQRRLELLPELLVHTDPRVAAIEDMSPLHHAVREGDAEAVAALLDPNGRWWQAHNVQPSELLAAPPDRGPSPLYWAVEHGHLEVVRALLEAGAQPLEQMTDDGGFRDTPVHLAVARGKVEILRALLQPAIAAMEAAGDGGSGAGGAAAQAQAQAHVQALNRAVDGERLTPVFLALQAESAACLEVLLKAGADPSLPRDMSGGGAGAATGGKAGKKGQKGGAITRQNVHLRNLAKLAAAEASGASSSGTNIKAAATAESALSRALCALEASKDSKDSKGTSDMQAMLAVILANWRPWFSGNALRQDLGPTACGLVKAWLLQHAEVTLWPVTKALNDIASKSPLTRSAGPAWLSAPLVEMLLQLVREALGPDWHVSRAAGTATGARSRRPPRLAVWHLICGAVVGTVPPPGDVPAYLTCPTLRELLARGVVDPDERAPQSGTGQAQLNENSTLLHKVCFTGDSALLNELLAAGANPTLTDMAGNAPLHVAATRPHREEVADALIRRLLKRQADPKAAAGKGGAGGGGSKEGADEGDGKEGDEKALATAAQEVAEEEFRQSLLRQTNHAGMRPEELATSKKTRKLLQQLGDEVSS